MQRFSFYLFTGLLIFCPLAFGTVEPWSMMIMELMAPLALLACLWTQSAQKNWHHVPGLVPLCCFLLYIAAQLVPLPVWLLTLISPATVAIYKPVIDLSSEPLFLPLSINSKATAAEFCRYFSYACFYILTVQLTASYSRLRRVLLIVLGLASAIAFLAIIQKFTSPDKIYWFRAVPDNATATGPWIYHNHFAGFMAMMLPLALAFFLHYRPRIRQAIPWREKLLSVFTLPHANLHILLGFGSILIALSIAISLSRGGMISAILAVLICIILLQRSGQLSTQLMPIIACLIMVSLAMLWFGWEPILARFNSMTNSEHEIFDGRLLIWQDSAAMIKDFWLTGAGFGTFICLFPIYRNLMPGRGVVDHAHNDYIELVTDGGVIGLVLVAAFLGTVFWKSGRMLRKRRDDFPKILFSGCAASICAILIHSITDFNMHNGANGLYFFFLCGLLVSASHTRRRSSTAQSFLTSQPPPRLLMGFPVLLIAAATLLFNQGQARARVSFQPIATMYLNKNIPADRLLGWQQQARKAQRADPLEGRYPFASANISTFTGSYAAARKNYIRSLRLDPTQAAYLLQAGFYLGSIDNDAAISLLTAAARVDRTNADINKELANWLLRKGETDKGLARLREALALDRRQNNFSEYVAIALLNNLDLSVMEQVLPDQPLAHIQFANFLAKQGDVDMASFYYLNAMNFLDNDPETKPWFFHSAYWFFMNEKQYDNALAVIRKGLVYHPDDASMHILAGDVYRRLDIDYRAREQYRQALVIAPGNIRATRGLSALAREE